MTLHSIVIALVISSVVSAAEHTPRYPLWDNRESVADYAKRVNLPATQTFDLGGGVKMELVLIPAGKFIMGTPKPTPVNEDGFDQKIFTGQLLLAVSAGALLVLLTVVIIRAARQKRRPQFSLGLLLLVTISMGCGLLSAMHWRHSVQALEVANAEFAAAWARYRIAYPFEKPAHPVTLTKPFYMGKYDVTQEQYQQIIGTNPSHLRYKDNPVEMMSWDNTQVFCKKLAERTRQTIRLPTEAEWEYACRAGTESTYYSGDSDSVLDRVAWYETNSNSIPHPAGQKEPNKFGLYDMHGNVWQWCQDWYSDDYYGISESENPPGPAPTAVRLLRGGSCYAERVDCRSANRKAYDPDHRNSGIGFRVVVVQNSVMIAEVGK